MALNNSIIADGIEIRISLVNDEDYISLTDIAKKSNPEDPRFVIQNWMRNRNTIEFLGLWETLNNPNFNRVEFEAVKNSSGLNSFVLSAQRWIESTNAIGIVSKAGRYGGTYAHTDIAFEFASWVSPQFKLFVIKDYQRLKQDESNRLTLGWDVKRELAKVNYRVHTDAIKEQISQLAISKQDEGFIYASEADLLNLALFGMTAKQWKSANPSLKGNIRDYATVEQLLVLTNLEALNSFLLKKNVPKEKRYEQLCEVSKSTLLSVSNSAATDKIKDMIKQA